MNGESIDLERQLPAPLQRVWAALVDPSQAGTWFAAKASIVPELGGAYELFWLPDSPDHQSTIGCRITAIAPPRYLAFTWRGPDELSAIMNEGTPRSPKSARWAARCSPRLPTMASGGSPGWPTPPARTFGCSGRRVKAWRQARRAKPTTRRTGT